MDELNNEREISLGLCHSIRELSSDEIQCLSFCKCDRRANSGGRKFSRVDSAGSWNRNPMRVNRIGLVTSLSLHHHHPSSSSLLLSSCQQGEEDWNRNFFFATKGAVVPMKSPQNDCVIFRCFIFQTFYSRPVCFFFLAGTGIVAKNALFVMF